MSLRVAAETCKERKSLYKARLQSLEKSLASEKEALAQELTKCHHELELEAAKVLQGGVVVGVMVAVVGAGVVVGVVGVE